MKKDPLLAVDFSALKTLRLVYELRSFTAAAASLDVNQSAVSYTIDKLRKVFSDPLFFRQGGQVIATEQCAIIARQVSDMLEAFETMVAPATFDPSTAESTVRIACNYYERQIILPHVIKALRQRAPGMRLELVNATHRGATLLKRGEADLLMGPLKPDESGFYCRTLLKEHYTCVMDPENPLAAGKLSMDDYVGCNHITVTYGGEWRSRYLTALDALGQSLNETLQVPSPAGLECIIATTDLVSTIPKRLALTLPSSLAVVEGPCPTPFDIYLVWTTRTRNAPLHTWFRGLVFDLVRQCVR